MVVLFAAGVPDLAALDSDVGRWNLDRVDKNCPNETTTAAVPRDLVRRHRSVLLIREPQEERLPAAGHAGRSAACRAGPSDTPCCAEAEEPACGHRAGHSRGRRCDRGGGVGLCVVAAAA